MKNKYVEWTKAMMESWKKLEGGKTAQFFSNDVEYYETLDAAPCETFADVVSLWEVVPKNQSNIQYDFDVIAIGDDCAVINWTMHRHFSTEKEITKQYIDGIFQIKLNSEGKCYYFKQWRFTKVEK